MTAIVKEFTIVAPPENVYQALTKQEGIARWWTEDLSIQPEVGSLAEFRFAGGTVVIQVEIAELERNKRVSWICKQGLGFEGTTITWQLTPVVNGTRLVFTQAEYPQTDVNYQYIDAIWDYFLGSLDQYFALGEGTPDFPGKFSDETAAD